MQTIRDTLGLKLAACLLVCAVCVEATAQDSAATWKNAQQYVPGIGKEVVDAACKEGTVTLYTLVLRRNSEDVIDLFQKRFPCLKLKTFVGSGGMLVQRFTSEFTAGTYLADVWMNSSPLFGDELAEKKMFLNWTPPNVPAIADQWKKDGYWYPIGLAHLAVSWNTQDLRPDQQAWLDNLKTWDQVGGAPFVGSTAVVDIRAGGTTHLLYSFLSKQYGADSWRRLADLKPTVFSGINPLTERLAVGEFSLAVGTVDTSLANRLLSGAPLKWKYPEPGLAVPYFLAVAAKSPHPNAAKLLLAWSLSKDGQTAWVNSTELSPASTNAVDQRPVTREPWYKLPATYYRPNWKEISDQYNDQVAKFAVTFGK